jgi:hypothetical protein
MKMRTFNIEFVLGGQSNSCILAFKGDSAGHAQAKFHRKFPDGKILCQWSEARINGRPFGRVNYPPVSTIKVAPLPPVPKAEEQTFGFFDQCLSNRPPQDFNHQPKQQECGGEKPRRPSFRYKTENQIHENII